MKEKIKCSECEFCKSFRPAMETAGHLFAVTIRISMYILDYFQEHRIVERSRIPGLWKGLVR